ncbi:MAG: hypothetical protein AAF641_16310 [Pseudomonadota bacterium]
MQAPAIKNRDFTVETYKYKINLGDKRILPLAVGQAGKAGYGMGRHCVARIITSSSLVGARNPTLVQYSPDQAGVTNHNFFFTP